MKIFCLFILFIFCFLIKTMAQPTNYPQIGKRCPDFCLTGPGLSSTSNNCLKDFNGKYLILYFFSTGCTASFSLLPEIKSIQEKFARDVQILPIGRNNEEVKLAYQKFNTHYGLKLSVFFDSAIFNQFLIKSVPYLIWLDKKNTVRAITSPEELNEHNLSSFIQDQPFPYRDLSADALEKQNREFDFSTPLYPDFKNYQSSAFYFSAFSKWTPDLPMMQINRGSNDAYGNTYFQAIGVPLKLLINLVYLGSAEIYPSDPHYGQFFTYPQFVVHNKQMSQSDFATGKNVFSYWLMTPHSKEWKQYLQKQFTNDVHEFLGYRLTIKKQLVDVWQLKASPRARKLLKTKGGSKITEGTLFSQHYQNIPVKRLIQVLWAYHQNEPPFIDESGIKSNIDISFDAIMSDLNDVKKALQEKGIYLVKGKKRMNVIVAEKSLLISVNW